MALMSATNGRTIAMIGPSNAQVSPIAGRSTSGLEMAIEVLAPLLAPRARTPAANGMTEHEHSGMGAPNSAPLNTPHRPLS